MTKRYYDEIETPEYPDGIKYYILLEKFPTFLQSLNIPQNMTYPTPQDDSSQDIFELHFSRHLPIISALFKELSQQRKINSTASTTSTPSYQGLIPNLTTTPIDTPFIPPPTRRKRSVMDYDDSDYYDITTTKSFLVFQLQLKEKEEVYRVYKIIPFLILFSKLIMKRSIKRLWKRMY